MTSSPRPTRPALAADRTAGWHRDFLASLVVFMVALPLCIAIAQACKLPAEAGLITGVLGGLVVGLLAGSPLQVSGPAAGLIVIILNLVERHGLAGLGVAVFLGGCLQLLAGALRLGQWFRAVSPAVIHGMLAGIGLVIIAKQVHVLVDDVPADGVVQNMLSIPVALVKAFVDGDGLPPHHRAAATVGLLAIAVLFGWRWLTPRPLRIVPAALVAVVTAVVAGRLLGGVIQTVEVQSNLLAAVHWLPDADPALLLTPEIWQAAVTIALIASAETLLCAAAVDRMHTGPRTQFNRELAAQGVGNTLCGFLGVLPMTGVIVRSAANVEAGARTRLSAVLHGAWLLLFVTLLPGLLRLVPTTSLAAILIVTGYRLIDPAGVRALWRTSRSEALILAATAGTIVATDLLVGVLTGVALALLKLLWTFAHLRIRLESEPERRRATLRLHGAATFLRLPQLAAALERVPANTELHVDFEHLSYVDHACLELFFNWEKQHEAAGGSLVLDWESLHARFHSPRIGPRTERPPAGHNGTGHETRVDAQAVGKSA
jgi:MFS superfamily sulfate permease-like transporter